MRVIGDDSGGEEVELFARGRHVTAEKLGEGYLGQGVEVWGGDVGGTVGGVVVGVG